MPPRRRRTSAPRSERRRRRLRPQGGEPRVEVGAAKRRASDGEAKVGGREARVCECEGATRVDEPWVVVDRCCRDEPVRRRGTPVARLLPKSLARRRPPRVQRRRPAARRRSTWSYSAAGALAGAGAQAARGPPPVMVASMMQEMRRRRWLAMARRGRKRERPTGVARTRRALAPREKRPGRGGG